MKSIDLNGITVKVIRKRIKNMYLRVNKKGEAVVSAPIFLHDETVKDFVYSKEEWLWGALDRTAERAEKAACFEDGEKRTLFGKEYTLHLDTSKKGGYYFSENDIVLCVGAESTTETRRKALAGVYRSAMEGILPDVADVCQEKCGIYAKEWRIRDMKTRWGSCNTKEKRIWINLWLVEKPPECLTAVIYHELAHLKVKGHNKAFYALLEKIYPNYHEAERLLEN